MEILTEDPRDHITLAEKIFEGWGERTVDAQDLHTILKS
jgi:hypothetical protein